MSHKILVITKSDGTEHGRWAIEHDQIVRAGELEVELHNRDNPDDIWTMSIEHDQIVRAGELEVELYNRDHDPDAHVVWGPESDPVEEPTP